ncbi:MAG: NAD(P)H-hydrate dehydratase, partial [Bacteroidales bacterium]|nr:NAD(P)H-hydrate dehydratase [Bacteroidales bacterium]
FGIGLHRPAAGIHAEAIRALNASDAPVVAIDIPSGLFADQHTPSDNDIVMAELTLSIQFQKLAFLLPENYPFCGDVQVLDIGMAVPPTMKITRELLTTEGVRLLLRRSTPYAHKGTFGHGLLVAGSAAMPGAAILAATAALRGGIGKLTVHTAAEAARHIPARLPEAILHPDAEAEHTSRIDWHTLPANINAIALGPGLGTHPKTVALVKDVLDSVQAPVILDADALNILADNKTRLAFLPPYSILTPHFAEFERLAGHADDDFQRVEMARTFAQRYNIVLILKGHHSVISLPDGMQFFNSTGNAGMATAGSGDTLTGLLLALLAQGYNPVETALLGTFLHGLAGDLYAEENAPQSLIASDLPQYFGKAFRYLESNDYLK